MTTMSFKQMREHWLANRPHHYAAGVDTKGDVPCDTVVVDGIDLISRHSLHIEFCLMRGMVEKMRAELREHVVSILNDSKHGVYTVETNAGETEAFAVGAFMQSWLCAAVGGHGGIMVNCPSKGEPVWFGPV
jgi:hypothetical protein